LIENVSDLSGSNFFSGQKPDNSSVQTFAVIASSNSPLSDSHNSLAMKLSTPKKINETSVAISIMAQSNIYETANTLIWDIYNALGGDDGGCITQNDTQMFIIPVETPHFETDNTFKLNFIVRTQK
jgi:hypothetical protein